MKSLLRNWLLPLLLVLPGALYVANLATEITAKFPQLRGQAMLSVFGSTAVFYFLLVLILSRFRRPEGQAGFLLGLIPGLIGAFVGGGFGTIMLAFSSDSGMEALAETTYYILPIVVAAILIPITFCSWMGALIGNRTGLGRELRAKTAGG